MNCAYSKERLALFVEGDLPDSLSKKIEDHLEECASCRQFLQDLQASQSMLKSLRQQTIAPAALAGIRQDVLCQIGDGQESLGWVVKVERFVLLGFRRPQYVIAALIIAAIVSVTLLGQIRQPGPASYQASDRSGDVVPGAVFEGKDALLRPEGYRDWISVSTRPLHNVYINPAAYREYVKDGEFPEGTVMVLEMASEASGALEASVKDSRFDGGWGYFAFTDGQGKPKAKAEPEISGCRSCHAQQGETDHVFTQFYSVLRSVRS